MRETVGRGACEWHHRSNRGRGFAVHVRGLFCLTPSRIELKKVGGDAWDGVQAGIQGVLLYADLNGPELSRPFTCYNFLAKTYID